MDDKAFRAYYEFDDDDLYLNRQGRLSDKQYKTLLTLEQDSRRYNRIGAIAALAAAALVPCLVLPLSVLTVLSKDWTTTITAWVGSAVWLAVFGGAGLWLLRSARAASRTNWAVVTVTGQVELKQENRQSGGKHNRTYTVYSFKLGDSEFGLDDTLVGHLHEGETVAVYCADGEIISVEQLAGHAV